MAVNSQGIFAQTASDLNIEIQTFVPEDEKTKKAYG